MPFSSSPPLHLIFMSKTAFDNTILTGLGTRRTAEWASLTAARSVGGLQLGSLVERAISGVAREILFIVKRNALASCIARDALREDMLTDPGEVNNSVGFIPRGMSFSAGYGIYIGTSTDRIVGACLISMQNNTELQPNH